MSIDNILEAIDAEISRLRESKGLLEGSLAAVKAVRPGTTRTMSAETNARMAAAQKAPWAKRKRSKTVQKNAN